MSVHCSDLKTGSYVCVCWDHAGFPQARENTNTTQPCIIVLNATDTEPIQNCQPEPDKKATGLH